jgi:hypothetical protein
MDIPAHPMPAKFTHDTESSGLNDALNGPSYVNRG